MSQDMNFESLVGVFAGRAAAGGNLRPRASCHAAEIDLPERDQDDVSYEALDDEWVVDLLGGELLIAYSDWAGQKSHRAIGLHGLRRDESGDLVALAYCLERHGPRAFRVARISSVTDLASNHVIEGEDAVAGYFERRLAEAKALAEGGGAGSEALLYAQRHGLKILLFLARCDGEQHPSETAVILSFLSGIAEEEGRSFDRAAAEAQLETIQVDEIDFARALRALREGDKDTLITVGYFARRLIAADGAVSPEEAAFEAELEKILQRIRAS